MADEEPDKSNAPVITPGYDIWDPSAQTLYANDAAAVVLDSEVVMVFGDGTKTADGKHLKTLAKVVMTHAMFMRCVDYWMNRYRFIETTFNGRPPTVSEVMLQDPDRVSAAFEKYLASPLTNTTNEDHDGNGS